MKCLVCEKWGFKVICKDCLGHIELSPRERILKSGIKVYSFYHYEDVAYLLKTKYHLVGSRILTLLANKAAKYFFANSIHLNLWDENEIVAMGLDDYPYGAYSHVGIILKAFATASQGKIRPIYGALKAKNRVKYAGKNLSFRESHPKGFIYDNKPRTLILLDDIITTGTSFNEAIRIVQHAYSQVLFCLALCDART